MRRTGYPAAASLKWPDPIAYQHLPGTLQASRVAGGSTPWTTTRRPACRGGRSPHRRDGDGALQSGRLRQRVASAPRHRHRHEGSAGRTTRRRGAQRGEPRSVVDAGVPSAFTRRRRSPSPISEGSESHSPESHAPQLRVGLRTRQPSQTREQCVRSHSGQQRCTERTLN